MFKVDLQEVEEYIPGPSPDQKSCSCALRSLRA